MLVMERTLVMWEPLLSRELHLGFVDCAETRTASSSSYAEVL
jgi:hypothetical protein